MAKLLKSESGISILQVMVFSGIIAGLIGYFSTSFYQNKKAQQAQQDHKTFNQIQSTIQGTMSQSETLTQSESAQFRNLQAPVTGGGNGGQGK